jgi:hypothetical protein
MVFIRHPQKKDCVADFKLNKVAVAEMISLFYQVFTYPRRFFVAEI